MVTQLVRSLVQWQGNIFFFLSWLLMLCFLWSVLDNTERPDYNTSTFYAAFRNSTKFQYFFSSSSVYKPYQYCPDVFRTFLLFNLLRVPNDAPEFPIAFTVVAHWEISRLARFLRMIYRPQNSYCIQIDRNSTPQFHSSIKNLVSCFGPNVFLVQTEPSAEVHWNDASVVEPQLVCAKKLLTASAKWKYLVNCIGQAFPLRTNQEMVSALSALNGSNLIETISKPQHRRMIGNNSP